MTVLVLVVLVLVLLLLRQNLFVILGCVTAFAYVMFAGESLDGIILDAWSALNKEILLSIPLYILAGNVMARGGIANRLIRFMRALTVSIPGGLAIAAVLSCAVFAAVTGSGTVTLVAVGAVMYPALLEAGYSKQFSLGALCAAGTLGVIIPPSIPLILYGVMTHSNIADLFMAGIGPGLLLTAAMVVYAMWSCWDAERRTGSAREILVSLADGLWALLMPVIILGGIYSGIFTPTESAAVAVVYALLVEMFIYKELDLGDLAEVTVQTSRLLGALFPVLMLAFSLNMFLTYQQVPEQMVSWLSERISNPGMMLIGTNLFLLLIGCLMDIGSAILVLAPMLVPLVAEQGISPLHFGIMMVVNLEIGYLTPPLGLNLIVAMGVFNEDFWTICRAVLPFVIIMLVCLMLIAFIPGISLLFVG
ncbi:MAG: TRAP transporter large permease [Gammaproteobacteria bacterium]|nr:TRAP transporter large permease [Gammaproteobacteria bacterium]MCP4090525.1 TRAP transporter large permease [Gammaproteobacteria bacterium]MCP4276610.1 TRAP transporter large permease [Gammaproteobacteria bacterium]MCP4831324.1 TRAP transporter large permease [Gammaproteobacteria bacterium]MCP4927904.1 TRAP transporter large permease [Gammaproteobacteria bacterium]